jgi:outer membrane protein TolC
MQQPIPQPKPSADKRVIDVVAWACAVLLLLITTETSIAQNARPITRTPRGIEAALQSVVGVPQRQESLRPPETVRSPISPPAHASGNAAAGGSDQGLVNESAGGQQSVNLRPPLVHAEIPWIPGNVARGPCDHYLDQYRGRAMETADDASTSSETTPATADLEMWWDRSLAQPLGFAPQAIPVDIASLTQIALASSPYVQSVLTEPRIRQSDLVIADAEFDSTMFLESKYADTNEPIGNTLTTGDVNSTRYRDETFTSALGLRRKTRRGGELEVVQRFGFQENNSIFLDPNPQGTSRLEVNFTQPLLRDGGKAVNNVRILLAKLDLQVTNSQVRGDLENHLIDVCEAYWELYEARAEWLQRNRLLRGAEHLHQVLQARDEVDSQKRQILRALAAVESRKSDLVRAATRIRNAQAKLRMLTGNVELINAGNFELTPQDQPLRLPIKITARDSIITALDNRPDLAEAIRRIQAVSARVGAARNQVLPRLDLILGTYVAGLDDNRNSLGAWENQFDQGRPSYYAGFSYELPAGNRASKARLNRNRWEFSRAMYEFQQATEVTFTEVEIAVRETQSAFTEMVTKNQAIEAAGNEVIYLQDRWDLLPDPNESAILLIEDLLDAQERLADEERDFVAAQAAYALSWVQLRKAMGVLLRVDDSTTHYPRPAMQPAAQVEMIDAGMDTQGASLEEPQP